MKQQQRIALSVALLLVLSAPTIAFAPLHPRVSQSAAVVSSNPLAEPGTYRHGGSHQPLRLSNGSNNNDIKEDWNALTSAAGKFARDVGSMVVDVVKTGGNKLKEFVTTTLLPPSPEEDTTTAARSLSNPIVDTEDEDMFRGIFGEDLFVPLNMPSSDSIDHGHVLEQAAMLLEDSEVATSLLGYSLQYGNPFSQSSRTTTVNGKTSTSVQASFEVWGTLGQGVASVTSSDGNLEFVDLQVNSRLYRLNVHDSSPSSSSFNSKRTNPESSTWAGYDAPSALEEQDDAMEVEVLEGVRGRSAYNGRIMDAEILGKTIL